MKPIYLSILFFTLAGILMLAVFLSRPARRSRKPAAAKRKKALPARSQAAPSEAHSNRRREIIEWIKRDPVKVSQAVRQWMQQEKP